MRDYTSTPARRRLTDILNNGGADQLRTQWEQTEAAGDFAPLPAGTYEAHVESVQLFNAKTGTPGVKIQFRVCDGEHIGRFVWHDAWLTPAALPQTKRDCAKMGLTTLDQLENANVLPGRIRCKLRVALRREDDGTEYNKVRSFDVVSIDEPAADAFAPADDGGDTPADANADDASFAFGANTEGAADPAGGAP